MNYAPILPLAALLAFGATRPEQAADNPTALRTAPKPTAVPAAPAATDTTALLRKLLQSGYPKLKVVRYKAGDLNADGRPDLIVVAEKPCGSDSGMPDSECRTTLLVLNEGWPKLRVAATNDEVVGCSACGGAGVGDPLQSIVIKGSYFSIESLYGDCTKTHFVVTFHYDKTRRDWLLHRFGRVDYACRDVGGSTAKEVRIEGEQYGKVSFAKFNTGY